jgi:hypothetical protein
VLRRINIVTLHGRFGTELDVTTPYPCSGIVFGKICGTVQDEVVVRLLFISLEKKIEESESDQ